MTKIVGHFLLLAYLQPEQLFKKGTKLLNKKVDLAEPLSEESVLYSRLIGLRSLEVFKIV